MTTKPLNVIARGWKNWVLKAVDGNRNLITSSIGEHKNLLAVVVQMFMLRAQMFLHGRHEDVVVEAFQQFTARALYIAFSGLSHHSRLHP